MARRKTDSRKQATRESALPSAACSALGKIRRQIGRLETHARIKYPGDPTPEQCTILARELANAADTLENELKQLWKLRCEVGNCPWVVSQNDKGHAPAE